MNDFVYVLFSDNTWRLAERKYLNSWLHNHKWEKDFDFPKSAIVISGGHVSQYNLEDE
jgi:hypothetical protein